jgi:hypothetical protein
VSSSQSPDRARALALSSVRDIRVLAGIDTFASFRRPETQFVIAEEKRPDGARMHKLGIIDLFA